MALKEGAGGGTWVAPPSGRVRSSTHRRGPEAGRTAVSDTAVRGPLLYALTWAGGGGTAVSDTAVRRVAPSRRVGTRSLPDAGLAGREAVWAVPVVTLKEGVGGGTMGSPTIRPEAGLAGREAVWAVPVVTLKQGVGGGTMGFPNYQERGWLLS